MRRRFVPCTGERLVVGSVEPIAVNLDKALAHLKGGGKFKADGLD